MSAEAILALVVGFATLFFLLFLGVQLVWSMLVSGVVGFAIIAGIEKSLSVLNYTAWSVAKMEMLICLPLFIVMGRIVYESGMGDKLFELASSFVGRLRGGLAMAVSLGCGAFGAVSGSVIAAVGTFGPIAIPELAKYRYDKNFSATVVACSSTFASMIPPSIAFIIYASITETSIGKLFMAGIIPGIITVVVYCFTIYIMVRINPSLAPETAPKATWRQRGQLTLSNIPLGCVALLILGGIYLGWFTPTESAGIGALAVFALAMATRRTGLKKISNCCISSVRTVAMVILLITGGFVLGYFVAVTRVTLIIGEYIAALGLNHFLLVAIIFLFYLILGCVMDQGAMMILTVPILYPALEAVGFNSIWFGVFVIKAAEIAVITPPVGMIVYVTEGAVGDKSVRSAKIFRRIIPFVIADTFVLALITAFPQICLWLPGTMD
jgi:C4-dicarboxylate transporter DctM subunit